MPYAVQSDIEPRPLSHQELVELTDDAKTGEVDASVVTRALTEASSRLDSYCNGRYKLPLAVSDQVKSLTVAIAVYLLFLWRRRMPPEVQLSYESSITFLKDVSAGRAALDQPAAPQVTEMVAATKDHTAAPDTFDPNKLTAF